MRERARIQSGRAVVVAMAILSLLLVAAIMQPVDRRPPVSAVDAVELAEQMDIDPTELITTSLPQRYHSLPPDLAADMAADDPGLALTLNERAPLATSSVPAEAGLARLMSGEMDAVTVDEVFTQLPNHLVEWLAVLFPSAVGNLEGAPIDVRINANAIRLAASVAASRSWPSPPRPWTQGDREPRPDFQRVIDGGHRLVYFDPLANRGQGAWAELVGDLDTASHVGVLVPGGSAFVSSDNFTRYSGRAASFVSAAEGELAMVVWAGSPFPSGWIQESTPSWAQDAAIELTAFTADLRHRLPAHVSLTVAGHSYGGAVVGLAETYDLDADRVLHLASAGAGYGVWSPHDYASPCRERYDLMAPGDPIGYVQNIPDATGLGHGIRVSSMPGVKRLVTGRLPDDPDALDDVNRTLGSMGITGKEIGGVHAHSEIFIPDSDAWRSMLTVFTMGEPTLLSEQPPSLPDC